MPTCTKNREFLICSSLRRMCGRLTAEAVALTHDR